MEILSYQIIIIAFFSLLALIYYTINLQKTEGRYNGSMSACHWMEIRSIWILRFRKI